MNATFNFGDRVQVVQNPKAPKEAKHLLGKRGLFTGYSKPHGYAIIALSDAGPPSECLVHPENLQRSSEG